MSVVPGSVRGMDNVVATAAAAAPLLLVAVLVTLVSLLVKGFAGFLYRGVAYVARAVFDALVWLVATLLSFVGWALVGWWWRRWVAPLI